MKNIILSSLFILSMATTALFGQYETLEIGAKAPYTDVAMKLTDGTTKTLEELKGKNGLLVVFSCNTCPFVVGMKDGSFPGWEKEYNTIHALAKEKGLEMILINSNEAFRNDVDSEDQMIERWKEKAYTMGYAIDEESKLANGFGAKTTPHVFLLNADLELLYRGSIDNSWDPKRKSDEAYLKNAFEQMESGIKLNSAEPRGCSIKRVTQK